MAKVVDDKLLEQGIIILITFGPFMNLISGLQEISFKNRKVLQLFNFLSNCIFDLHEFHPFVFCHSYVQCWH